MQENAAVVHLVRAASIRQKGLSEWQLVDRSKARVQQELLERIYPWQVHADFAPCTNSALLANHCVRTLGQTPTHLALQEQHQILLLHV